APQQLIEPPPQLSELRDRFAGAPRGLNRHDERDHREYGDEKNYAALHGTSKGYSHQRKRPAEAGLWKPIVQWSGFSRFRSEQSFASDEIQQHHQDEEGDARQQVGMAAGDEGIHARPLIELF